MKLRGIPTACAAIALVVVALAPLPASAATRSLQISNDTLTETTSDTSTLRFAVTLSDPASRTVKVDYRTVAGTATSPTDYVAENGTLTFAAGDTREIATITVKGDKMDEYKETLSVKLSDPLRAAISDGTGIGTIADNDPPPYVSLPDKTIIEGGPGNVPIKLNRASAKPVTVLFYTVDGNDTFAGVDFDYVEDHFTIPAGSLSTNVSIGTPDDDLDEPNQYFAASIRQPVNAVLSRDDAEITIQDDEPTPQITVSDEGVLEGDSGQTMCAFTVTASVASLGEKSGGYTTNFGTASHEDFDYDAVVGTWTIPAQQTTTTVNVPVNGDTNVESTETFELVLSAYAGTSISDGTGTCTITDDDVAP